ncbi:MAG: NAD-glutamate dehydrogenase [Oleiphilus sp.]
MKVVDTRSKSQFLESIKIGIKEKLPESEAKDLILFADMFFLSSFVGEFEGRRISDLIGLLVSARKFIQRYDGKQAKVSVFDPNLEEHGWQSSHTALLILQKNMPFIVDSMRMTLANREIKTHTIQYSSFEIDRDKSGKITQLKNEIHHANDPSSGEGLVLIEVDRHGDEESKAELQASIEAVLADVDITVQDYSSMQEKISEIKQEIEGLKKLKSDAPYENSEIKEACEFLDWVVTDHYAFLGYVKLNINQTKKASIMQPVKGSELGILKSHPEQIEPINLKDLNSKAQNEDSYKQLVTFAKAPARSTVHRPAYPDCIAIKHFDAKGQVIGEHCFYGLYTAKAYTKSPKEIPILRKKYDYVVDNSELNVNDYRGKELVQLLDVYPRDELFQIDKNLLFDNVMGTLFVQERRQSRLFIREDLFGRFVNCLVYVPREIYSTAIRVKIQSILMDHFHGTDVEFNTFISESVLARTQITIKLDSDVKQSFNIKELEDKIISVTQSWEDDLETSLFEAYGEGVANTYINKYRSAFSSSYREEFSPRRAAIDIEHIENVSNGQNLGMSFYRALDETEEVVHFKLFHAEQPVTLSDVMPIFENMGFRVIGEHPYECIDREGRTVWIHDFTLTTSSKQVIDINKIRHNFESLFLKVWEGNAENDSFNRLVISAYLNWRQIAMLRSYARYMRQIRVSNSQRFIANTVVANTHISKLLIQLFESRFNPKHQASNSGKTEEIETEFLAELDNVHNLSEDKILRLYLDLIKATMRTNFYQKDANKQDRHDIAFKFHPRLIPNVPMPVPMYEIFIYSPRIEGVHLRGGKVARGGLRWSDRYEDYRTEVLGLVKAQQVKNAVIVPVGAKGGFVAKRLPDDREGFMKEGIACYQIFIRGLLSVTDNLVDGAVVKPDNVVCHDEDDFYLVVAADKGTATFSDIANEISLAKGHWLGDAFASGGSQGYDHKKMGITAKGAWVSVQRHFREMGHDIQTSPFTAIGIGDMAGDVFGNGMLLSNQTKLVAAFNHMHIFFDPSPDTEKSFAERQRLFDLPRSTWDDYDKTLISEGGGVFSRSVKSIKLSTQMQSFLGTKEKQMTPNQLIHCILKAEADLLWIGGIGTYAMASTESHADVGDKANDTLRITGKELKVKVVGEGGNLGMTQLSRIEYALNGGRLNTDFIDNAAGVDCSDHEVNIKILLNEILINGDLTEKQRNKLLADMTESVSGLVLKNNYRQTQAISIAHRDALPRMEEYRRLINSMESAGKLNRRLEFLPCDEDITERKSINKGLTRPELSVLISYVKGDLKETLINSTLPDEAHLASEIKEVFPTQILKKYDKALRTHRLRREIISTQVANDMVNHMGITFVERLKQSTGAAPASIALAYIIARDVFDLEKWWVEIESLDHKVPSNLQLQMMSELMSLMRRACRWLIRNRRSELNVVENMARFKEGIRTISVCLPQFLTGSSKEAFEQRFTELRDSGVPDELASTVAGATYLYAALGIIEAHQEGDGKLESVASIYYLLGNRLDLNWFGHQINTLTPLTHWQALAREAFREDLDWQQRALTVGLLKLKDETQTIEQRVDSWMAQHSDLVDRWKQMLTEFKASEDAEFSMYSVALRELLDLAQSTVHAIPK